MLQQTTVNTVIPYYEKWVKKYPNIKDLANASLQEVLKSWQGLGYYNRARNLHMAAQEIISKYHGKLPNDPQIIRKLPGFGSYTTGSVLSIAFDRPLTIIDANVRRVVMRFLSIQAEANVQQDKNINEFLLKVLPLKGAGDFNQALMELGALVCRSKEPTCNICPLKSDCQAYASGLQELIPIPKKRQIQVVHGVIGIIKNKSRFLIQKRPSQGLLADLWEFPGGKIEEGESSLHALQRELKEELDVDLSEARHLFDVKHFYTQYQVNLKVFQCGLSDQPKLHSGRKWVSSKQFALYPMPSGSAKIVERLLKGD
jgi:A/G-specific adenine glycosylase